MTCTIYTKIAVQLDIDASRKNVARLKKIWGPATVRLVLRVWRNR